MPLEAVMICVDNSDFTRNGDYTPTRFDSQLDAVNLLCGAKTNANPENSVGILAHAGDRVEVMITPTMDLGRMVSELPNITIGGLADFLRGVQTAQLALKHRQNKNQKQRIIAFVGSPIRNTEKELETLGKNLKKNNVSLDLISFGETEENTAKLEKLLNAVNSNDTSHMVEVPVGPKLLSDVLLSSTIVNPDGEIPAGGGDGFEFGINPGDDPELALALRISMEEENARQQAANPAATGTDAAGGAAAAPVAPAAPEASAAAAAPAAPAAAGAAMPTATDAALLEAMGMEDMDEELRQALLLSMQDEQMQVDSAPAETTAAAPVEKKAEEPAPAAAAAPEAAAAAAEEEVGAVDSAWFQDPAFVQELLGNLPGVDISDPRIQNALKDVGEEKKDEEKKDGDKK